MRWCQLAHGSARKVHLSKQTKSEGLRCNFFWIDIKHKYEGLICNFFGLISSILLKWPSYLEFYITWQLTKHNLLVCCDRYSPWKVTMSHVFHMWGIFGKKNSIFSQYTLNGIISLMSIFVTYVTDYNEFTSIL